MGFNSISKMSLNPKFKKVNEKIIFWKFYEFPPTPVLMDQWDKLIKEESSAKKGGHCSFNCAAFGILVLRIHIHHVASNI